MIIASSPLNISVFVCDSYIVSFLFESGNCLNSYFYPVGEADPIFERFILLFLFPWLLSKGIVF